MAKGYYLVDTCVLISLFRGNKEAKGLIEKIKGRIAISVITELELYKGAKTKERKKELSRQLEVYAKAVIDKDICLKAINIIKKYNSGKREVFIADSLIAATAIINEIPLLTYNTNDFSFIEELKLYKL